MFICVYLNFLQDRFKIFQLTKWLQSDTIDRNEARGFLQFKKLSKPPFKQTFKTKVGGILKYFSFGNFPHKMPT